MTNRTNAQMGFQVSYNYYALNKHEAIKDVAILLVRLRTAKSSLITLGCMAFVAMAGFFTLLFLATVP